MYTTLIKSAKLHTNLANPNWRVVDCRASLADFAYGRKSFDTYHIPGAQYADLENDLSGEIVPGQSGRHPLPERHALQKFFRSLGIEQNNQLVAYDDGNGAMAARFWWLARWMGVETMAVLDGGLQAYLAYLSSSGAKDINVKEIEDLHRSKTPSGFKAENALTKIVEADALLENKPDHVLIDARAQVRFDADQEPIDNYAGHIPGAVCLPFDENLNTNQTFKSAEALEARFADFTTEAKYTVCYCGSGVTAAHNILAMQIAGLGEACLYPGSWSEWIQDTRRPTMPPRSTSN